MTIELIIVTFRRKPELNQALLSAVNQEESSFNKITILDDDPNSLKENFLYDHSTINHKINPSNLGMPENINQIFSIASSDYLVLLHDDDLLSTDFLKTIKKTISDEPKADIILSSFKAVDYKNFKLTKANGRLKRRKLSLQKFCFGNIIGPQIAPVFKVKSFKDNCILFDKEFDPSWDWEFIIRALENKKSIIQLTGRPVAFWRYGNNTSIRPEVIRDFIIQDDKILSSLHEKFKGAYITHSFLRKWRAAKKYYHLKWYMESYNQKESLILNKELKKSIKYKSLQNLMIYHLGRIIRKFSL